ncbi:hypothetical protein EBZ39_15210 [bacterium]|nr:hypothetical protein [bacterium]
MSKDGWILWDYGQGKPFYDGIPTVYDTEREALLEIADYVSTRIDEFVSGDREELDTECDAVAVPVTVHPDGFISGEDFEWSPNTN